MSVAENIIGHKVVECRPMTDQELFDEGWTPEYGGTSVIVLDNGVKLYPSRDDEGNGPGKIFARDSKLCCFIHT